MTTITEGTLIHATLRLEDLIPAFMAELDRLIEHGISDDPADVRRIGVIHDRLGDIERRMAQPDYYLSEGSDLDLDYLMDELDHLAPEGMYFGAHSGDGADFGFWTHEED